MNIPSEIRLSRSQIWSIGRALFVVGGLAFSGWIAWDDLKDDMKVHAQSLEEHDRAIEELDDELDLTDDEISDLRLLLLQQEGNAARDREEIKGDVKAILSAIRGLSND